MHRVSTSALLRVNLCLSTDLLLMQRVTSGCRGYAVVMAAWSVVAARTIKSPTDATPEKENYSAAKRKPIGAYAAGAKVRVRNPGSCRGAAEFGRFCMRLHTRERNCVKSQGNRPRSNSISDWKVALKYSRIVVSALIDVFRSALHRCDSEMYKSFVPRCFFKYMLCF